MESHALYASVLPKLLIGSPTVAQNKYVSFREIPQLCGVPLPLGHGAARAVDWFAQLYFENKYFREIPQLCGVPRPLRQGVAGAAGL